jgi:hypothetical protein
MRTDHGSFFFADRSPESLAQRGFCKSGIRKIWFSKNLDIKILKLSNLGSGHWGRCHRHVLRHDSTDRKGEERSYVTE